MLLSMKHCFCSRLYEEVLHGLTVVSEKVINEQAEFAAGTLWKLMKQPVAG